LGLGTRVAAASIMTKPGSERTRDEKRRGGPRYAGRSWQIAEARHRDERFGRARSERPPAGIDEVDARDPDLAHPAKAEAGEHVGMRRVPPPRTPRVRARRKPRTR
jgi:hypothetical protein